MKEMNSVLIYKSYLEMMDKLLKTDSEWREAMTGLLNYGFNGIAPESDNPMIQVVYDASIPMMKSMRNRYLQKVEQSLND
jgi:hypothetical protein